MKLLTLNTHSLHGEDYPRRLELFVRTALELQPDLIAMQEVNQLRSAAPVDAEGRVGYVPAHGAGIPLRRGNHAAEAARRFRAGGMPASWTWLAVKRGYDIYDEGLALFSFRGAIDEVDTILLSRRDDYQDWRTRKALGVRLGGAWFYSVHLGWWTDEDSFTDQWKALEQGVRGKRDAGPVWLLGDFNAPDHVRGEGYDLVASSGWQDTGRMAGDTGITVRGPIDGWADQREGLRIDYIWCSEAAAVSRSQVVFNGDRGPVVSDHFGVLMETKEETI